MLGQFYPVRSSGTIAAMGGRRTRPPERSRAWYHQPRPERAPTELGLGDAELAPALAGD